MGEEGRLREGGRKLSALQPDERVYLFSVVSRFCFLDSFNICCLDGAGQYKQGVLVILSWCLC